MARRHGSYPQFRGPRGLLAAAVSAAFLAASAGLSAAAVPNAYAPDADYGRGSLVVGADGNVYRAVDAVKAKDPVMASGSPWQLAHAAFDLTLDVPGRFESIEKACAFIAGATISDTATVTVQVAPGTHELKGPLSIGHSQGRRVVLKGSKDPAKTVLDFGRGAGIVVDDGRALRIEGLSIDGEGDDHFGVSVENRSMADIRRCLIGGFKMGVSIGRGSNVVAEGVRVTSKQGSAGFHASAASSCFLKDCTASLKSNPGSDELTFGFASWFSSSMECIDCTATGWHDGFFAGNAASIDLRNSTATGNRFGGSAYLGSSLRAMDCTIDDSRDFGINCHEATAVLVDCRLRQNKSIALRSYGASMIEMRGQPCDIAGSELGMQSIAGGLFLGVKPTIRGNVRPTEIYQYGSENAAAFQFDK